MATNLALNEMLVTSVNTSLLTRMTVACDTGVTGGAAGGPGAGCGAPRPACGPRQKRRRSSAAQRLFFSSRRRHTRSVSAFLLNRSSDLRQTCHQVQPNQATYQKRQKCQPATYLQEVLYQL